MFCEIIKVDILLLKLILYDIFVLLLKFVLVVWIVVIWEEIFMFFGIVVCRVEMLNFGGLLFVFVMLIVIVVMFDNVGLLLLVIFIWSMYLLIDFWFRILVVVIILEVKLILNVFVWLFGNMDLMEKVSWLKEFRFEVKIVVIEVKIGEFFGMLVENVDWLNIGLLLFLLIIWIVIFVVVVNFEFDVEMVKLNFGVSLKFIEVVVLI